MQYTIQHKNTGVRRPGCETSVYMPVLLFVCTCTVEPLYNGHFGISHFCIFFCCYIEVFLYCVLNSESPLREGPLCVIHLPATAPRSARTLAQARPTSCIHLVSIVLSSLVPRLSSRTSMMNSKEGESLVPFRT